METEEIVSENVEIQEMDQLSSPVTELATPLETPEIESDDGKTRFKIPLITVDNRHIATLVEVTDTDQSTDIDYTPSEEKSASEIEFTPTEEMQPQSYDEVMDCDETQVREKPSVDFFIEKNVVELARCSWRGSSKNQRYLKGCLWSPDGTCLLATVNGDGMHVFETPRDLYSAESISANRPLDCLQSAVHIKEGGIVYDYCWFPFMSSNDPATCWYEI